MYRYRQALVIFSLSFVTALAVSVPLASKAESPGVLSARPSTNNQLVQINQEHNGSETNQPIAYAQSHSYGSGYSFSPRDGWDTVDVTNLPYKYDNTTKGQADLPPRRQRSNVKRGVGSILGGSASHGLGETWNSVKATGKGQPVTITWYTGEDLQNPSCWPESDWAPTDASFACALTLEGWTTKPSCFKFLELCNGPDKCIFVRVVDTCAGCKKGSKHVDLTKGAFAELADLDLGILTVQMRLATDPRTWHANLWGPKV